MPLISSIPDRLSHLYTKDAVIKATLWAIAHAAISTFLLNYFSGTAGASSIWIPAGIGLGVLILYGYQYWPFIFIGATVGELGAGHEWLLAMKIAGGAVIGMIVAVALLRRFTKFDQQLETLKDYACLLLVSFIAALVSTLINTQFLAAAGLIPPEKFMAVFGKWMTGDFFGMAFLTPVLLVLNGAWYKSWTRLRLLCLSFSLFLAFILGQVIFLGWFKSYIDLTGRGYVYFFVVLLVSLYFGRQGAMLLFSIMVTQSIFGAYSGIGFFGPDLMTRPGPSPTWAYLASACSLGLAVSLTVSGFKRKNDDLSLAAEVLEKSEQRFREIVANTPILLATYDAKSRLTDYVNPHFTKVLGYVASDFAFPDAWWTIAYPDSEYRKSIQAEWNLRADESQKTGEPLTFLETQTTCKDGSIKLINWGSYFAADRMVIYGVDVTEQRRAEEVLQVTSAVYRAMGEEVLICDADGAILMVNDAFQMLTSFDSKDLLGKSFSGILVKRHGASSYSDIHTSLEAMGRWEGQAWVSRKNDEAVLKFISIYSTFDEHGLPLQRVMLISEVTNQRKARELINQQANFDPLTGLPNRRLMLDRFDQLIKRAMRSKRSVAVIYMDLDNFKDINDSRGHDFGDQLLKGVATRLRSEVRETDTVARIGGDEFVILLGELERPEIADLIVREVSKNLAEPILINQQMVYVSGSMGISIYPTDGNDAKTLLLQADQAMYAAKAQGRNSFQYFTQSLQINASYRAGVIAELRKALEQKQFELHFQPIIHLETGAISHAEALIRWRKPNGELILPSAFIEIAEESGLIVEIGDWVLRESLAFLKSFELPPEFTLAINVSASQFNSNQHSAVSWLSLFEEYEIPPQSIVLEITERMMLNQSQRVIRKIAMLQEAGCKFSVDDFGTGYSSLASLKNFNFDFIKIDAEFIRPLKPDGQDAALVFAMISMAKGLGLSSVAEGVETQEQAEALAVMGCTYAQGYLYSKPLPADEFLRLL